MKHYTRQIASNIAAVILSLSSVCAVSAQELEYKMELGAMAGGCFYMGDANTIPLRNLSLAGGVLARYNFNPRMAVKGDLAVGHIQGTTEGLNNKFPGEEYQTFNSNVYELGTQFEYNFFAYGTGAGYKGSRRFTPYILSGLGITYASKPSNQVFAMNIPLGMGVKYKAAKRLNVGAEWTMRFATSDRLDVTGGNKLMLDDPYGIESKGVKNKVSYSFLMVYVSYDLFTKYRKCNN